MNREKFLKELEKYLSELDSNEKKAVISFYSDYFDKQTAMGKTEEQVIDELGEPRLLAKSIKENYKNKGNSYDDSIPGRFDESRRKKFKSTTINIDSWYSKLIAIVLGILAILLVVAIIAGLLAIFVKIVIPVLIILIIVSVIKNLFNR